ncbi:acyltransferase family protein [Chengkuizengella marina]|uniref:acyltransferase family protein n=1 Tax=Chengkuizengella marina TaxID=2507566 RepID=UPI00136DFEB0|nr:acyltransferase [Chengkuizengella marina]
MYLNYVNNFRAVAIIFVIASHVIEPFSQSGMIVYSIFSNLFREGTVLFVFIAGLLFHHLSFKYKYSKYLKSKVKYVLTPYIIISIPAILLVTSLGGVPRHEFILDYSKFFQVFYLYITGSHLGPLWFIPMIFIFYVISPILIKLIDWEYFNYVFIVSFIISILTLKNFDNVIQSFLHYFFSYIAGMYLSKNKEKILSFIDKYKFIILCLFTVLFTVGTITHYNDLGPLTDIFIYSNKIVLAFLIMFYLYKYDSRIEKKFDKLAQYSFGLFFIHAYISGIYFKIIEIYVNLNGLNDIYNFFLIIISTVFITVISLMCLIPAKKILGNKSRYLIG